MAEQARRSPPKLHLYSLPNEVFVQILTPCSTRHLLQLATVSRRIHDLVLRILHYRLLVAASLKEYKLILECYHPSLKLTEPHVFCTYLGTDGLSNRYEGKGSLYENVETAHRLGKLSSVYSRFRPEKKLDERNTGQSPLASSSGRTLVLPGVVGFLRADLNRDDTGEGDLDDDNMAVKRIVKLEAFEDFSQLCVVTSVVKVMPGSNLLLSAVLVEEGTVRIWRDWLKHQVETWKDAKGLDSSHSEDVVHDRPITKPDGENHQMLWVDQGKNVGLKLRVREKRWNRELPVLLHRDEEASVSYEVEIQELHIRTIRLLLTVEESLQQQQSYTNAVIFGAYPSRTT